jgi:DNA-binding NarL/FixJ family response regulator
VKPEGSASGKPLSPREQQLCALIALGLLNNQIAEEVILSARSVKESVANAMRKTGTHNRSQLVIQWLHSSGQKG